MKQIFSIEDHNVHLWHIVLSELITREQYFLTLLNPEELQRANRFRFPQHRQRFIIARGMLREILSTYTQISPQDIIFSYGPRGKPYLSGSHAHLQFNVSHSDDVAVYALTQNVEIGVDIQKIEDKFNDSVAKRFFSQQEYADLMQLSAAERPTAFCYLWACKEALIKAVGEGLYVPLGNFSVSLQDKSQWVSLTHADKTEKYFLQNFPVHDDYQCVFATAQTVEKITRWKWTLDGAQPLS